MDPRRSRVPILLLCCALGLACGENPEPTQEIPVAAGVEQVIVVGIDGLEWRVIDPLIAEGRLPNLARFIRKGARGKLVTLAPAYSPVIWTSIATGKLPSKHGITGFVTTAEGAGDRQVPFTSNSRKALALWNVLGGLGRTVAVVGWWTTWPAEPVNGVMVSDRMLYNRFNLWFGLEHSGADLPAQTHPPELFDELAAEAQLSEGIEDEFFAKFLPGAPRPAFDRGLHDPWYEMVLVYARDRAYARMLDRVLDRDSYDFVAYYLNGTDIASHYFWKYLFPEEWPDPIPDEELERGREIIPRYYSWVDEAIAPLLDRANEHTLVVVVSDHGFVSGHRPDSPNISGTHFRAAPPGVLVMAGGGLPEGVTLDRPRVIDLAPTLLHLLGHPVASDMDGQVLPLVAAGPGARPVEIVDSYEPAAEQAGGAPVTTVYDEAILDKLRALGYID